MSCLLFEHQPNKIQKVKSATNTTMTSKHDMSRHGLIHLTGITGTALIILICFITVNITVIAFIGFRIDYVKTFV